MDQAWGSDGVRIRGKMIYEIDYSHDTYTFEAKDQETAALVTFGLSIVNGAEADFDSENVPGFPNFEEAEEWYAETFGRTVNEGMEVLEEYVIDALYSVVLGNWKDREAYDWAYVGMKDQESLNRFKKAWNRRRYNMNNLTEFAASWADNIREARGKK